MKPHHRLFYCRIGMLAMVLIAFSLATGIVGYHYIEGLSWEDATLNASMILGGMGPVDTMKTVTGKLFASFYALYSCFVVIVAAGVLLMPLVHQVLARFHSDPPEH